MIKPASKTPPPKPLPRTAAKKTDGANVQLAAVIDELQKMDELLKIITNKHSAAQTAVEHPVDLASVMRTIVTLQKLASTYSFPTHPLRTALKRKFEELKQTCQLFLSTNVKEALIDFVSAYPSILMGSAKPLSVIKGFVHSGMLDEYSKEWPDFNRIINTC